MSELTIGVKCSECNATLEVVELRLDDRADTVVVVADPCPDCKQASYDEGEEAGRANGGR